MHAVILDSGPLGLLTTPRINQNTIDCQNWLNGLIVKGVEVVVPEIVDYEVRRELLRTQRSASIALLNQFNAGVIYLPITTSVMRRAAELWAQARATGQPTAGDKTIDADMILIAQAMSLNLSQATIATTNISHLSRFFSAKVWKDITP